MNIRYTSRSFNKYFVTDGGYKERGVYISTDGLWVTSNTVLTNLYNANAIVQKYYANPNNNYILQFYFQLVVGYTLTDSDVYGFSSNLYGLLNNVFNITNVNEDISRAISGQYALIPDRDFRYNSIVYFSDGKDVKSDLFGVNPDFFITKNVDKTKIPDGYFGTNVNNQYITIQEEGERRRDVYLNLSDFGQASNKLSTNNPGASVWTSVDGPYNSNATMQTTNDAGLGTATIDIHFPQGITGSGAFADDNGIACTTTPCSPIIFETNNSKIGLMVTVGVSLQ